MKKYITIAVILILMVSITSPAYCDDALRKFGRGLCNIITSPLELFEQIKRVNTSDGPLASITYGTLKGVGMIAVRAVVGVYEVVTFPIPFPKHYKPILKDPEFFFEETIW